jgi:hypothetical protein
MWSKNVSSRSDTESKPAKFRLTENPWLVLVVLNLTGLALLVYEHP